MSPVLLNDFALFLLTGFFAQLIGSLLGMGYGMVSSGVLLSLGITPALASASSNTASFVTTTVASWFHYKEGNVDKKTLVFLAVPGVIGSICGAVIVAKAPVSIIKPFIAFYLLIVSLVIAYKSVQKLAPNEVPSWQLLPLGLVGGAFGSIGGGGWGPIVNSHLVASGQHPRISIGSSNAAKCFSTLAAAATFAAMLKTCNVAAVAGLIVGGLFAAPLAAYSCKRLPAKALMVSMAVLLVCISGKIFVDSASKPAVAIRLTSTTK